MSTQLSRRQSFKLMAGAGLLSIAPISELFANDSSKAMCTAIVVTSDNSAGDNFSQFINASLSTSAIKVDHSHYESLHPVVSLPAGSLLIGLVNEADKVLIDSVLHERKAVMHVNARLGNDFNSVDQIPSLAEKTIQAALARAEEASLPGNREPNSGSLISFYAYL